MLHIARCTLTFPVYDTSPSWLCPKPGTYQYHPCAAYTIRRARIPAWDSFDCNPKGRAFDSPYFGAQADSDEGVNESTTEVVNEGDDGGNNQVDNDDADTDENTKKSRKIRCVLDYGSAKGVAHQGHVASLGSGRGRQGG